jgi:hypothetical protein
VSRPVRRGQCLSSDRLSSRRAASAHRCELTSGGGESTDTPDSVPGLAVRWRPSLSAGDCPPALAAYPGVNGRAALSLLGLAPGGVYRAARVTPSAGALLPHRFTLTCATGVAIGGLLSVALSCGSPRLGVTQHPALRSPDVPRTGRARTRLPGRLATTTNSTTRWRGPALVYEPR